MKQAITVKGLTKAFKKNDVLKGVDFTVESGEIFALLGSNGAGKTTTINILTTLMGADSGEATVNGFSIAEQPEKIRQSISLTGQFAEDLLKKVDLLEAADRRVATFSGGMRRRLDIAMSLIGNPPIVFLDEPTTGLDPEARKNMWQTVRALANKGITIFLTTQYLDEADELADTIAVLHEGKIVASGTAMELKKLVPGGLIKFTFETSKEVAAATVALGKQYEVVAQDAVSITVSSGGSVAQVAALFTRLRDAKIEPIDFSQQVPTLDDVFFKLTGKKKEEK
jgi:ABC-2 type transport system ATP-binding protein